MAYSKYYKVKMHPLIGEQSEDDCVAIINLEMWQLVNKLIYNPKIINIYIPLRNSLTVVVT